MIEYTNSLEGITPDHLRGGFFVGWPNRPTPEIHLRLLQGSDHVVLAIDRERRAVIGFVTAVSDGVLSAYIPFLEVLERHQSSGFGMELLRRLLDDLEDLYMIDLQCDAHLQPWYERLGMKRATGMMVRSYQRQAGQDA